LAAAGRHATPEQVERVERSLPKPIDKLGPNPPSLPAAFDLHLGMLEWFEPGPLEHRLAATRQTRPPHERPEAEAGSLCSDRDAQSP
jgi:hypothetical protein